MADEQNTPTQLAIRSQDTVKPKIDLSAMLDMFDKNDYSIADQKKALDKVTPGFSDLYSDADYLAFRNKVGKPAKQYMKAAEPSPSLYDKVIQNLRMPLDAVASGAGGLLGAPGGPAGVAIGAGSAAAATDAGLRSTMTQKPPSTLGPMLGMTPGSPADALQDTAETLGTNELTGRIGNKVLSGLNGLIKEWGTKGSVAGPLADLDATYSQYKERTFGSNPVSKWVEDIFAAGSKAKALENSGQLNLAAGTDLAKKMTGRTNVSLDWLSRNTQLNAENQFKASLTHSNALADNVANLAKANIMINPLPDGGIEAIPGPINLGNSIQAAQNFLDNRKAVLGDLSKASGQDVPLIASAQQLIAKAQPIFDPQTGQLIRSKPIGFKEAWDLKKGFDELAYGGGATDVSFSASTFRNLGKAVNEDIENSLPHWANDPGKTALRDFLNAKATVAQRHNVFDNDGLRQLLDTENSTVPEISKITSDPQKLQRALNASELKMPGGVISSSNMKRDLQGHKFVEMLSSAWNSDPIDPTKGTFDARKLSDSWNSYSDESKKMLFSASNRADIDQFVKNLAMTQQKQVGVGMNSKMMMAGRASVILGAGLISGGNLSHYAEGIGGMELGGAALAKLLTNPKAARLMVAVSSGAPLNMSQQAASKIITGALTGYTVNVLLPNGQKSKATVDPKTGELDPMAQ